MMYETCKVCHVIKLYAKFDQHRRIRGHNLGRASKIYGQKAFFKYTLLSSDRATLLTTAHTAGLRCGTSLSADCGYNL